MKIGIDFDNTIACYSDIFYLAALERGLIPTSIEKSKPAVKNHLHSLGKRDTWTELQGYVYGACMDRVSPFEGFETFCNICRTKGITLTIISHKTPYPYLGPKYPLHQAAKNWLHQRGFSSIPAFFEVTLEKKLDRIGTQQCDYFIDDLPELLQEPAFPSHVKKILFDPTNNCIDQTPFTRVASWHEISKIVEHAHAS